MNYDDFNKRKLSIIITTYNRKDLLSNVLDSIEKSEVKDLIEIIIVDDGSTDNTKEATERRLNRCGFKFLYSYQKNAGRAKALKAGILKATSEYMVIVDSDDEFSPLGLNTILDKINSVDTSDSIGFVFLCSERNGTVLGDQFPEGSFTQSYIKTKVDLDIKGDKKEVVPTKIAQENIYCTFDDERRVPTSYLWAKMDEKLTWNYTNSVVCFKDYLADGMTANILKIRMKSPNGSQSVYSIYIGTSVYKSKKFRLKSWVNYYRFYFHGGRFKCEKKLTIYNLLGVLGGYIYFLKDRSSCLLSS